jgi:hypothetical protein
MGTSGNQFSRIETVHNFQLFGNAGVITFPGCDLMFRREESKDFFEKMETFKLYMLVEIENFTCKSTGLTNFPDFFWEGR